MECLRVFRKTTAVLVSLVLLIGALVPVQVSADTPQNLSIQASTGPLVFTLADLGDQVPIHTDKQAQFLDGSYVNIGTYATGSAELSRPLPVTLSWSVKSTDSSLGALPTSYTVTVSEYADLSSPWVYTASGTSLKVYNLKIGTTYYWAVSCVYGDTVCRSGTASFTTDGTAPRNLYVDGVTNVRDMGGWPTVDGGYVRQGLLIRCGRLSANNNGKPEITNKGIQTMAEELGVRCEIELRKTTPNYQGITEYGGRTDSPLGADNASYVICPLSYDGNVLTNPVNKDSIRTVFATLADESNYPIIFHCSIGTDRTGMIAYLVNGLLGVSETDLLCDYLFSNFGRIGSSRATTGISKLYPLTIKSYEGASLSEKIYNYLSKEIGIPTGQLDSIIRILKQQPEEDTQPKGTPVSTAEEFAAMEPNGTYYLTQDICVDTSYANTFTGTLDGNGHTVTVTVPLFALCNGTVKNLTLAGEVCVTSGFAGALAAVSDGMTATSVINRANVTATDTSSRYVGGLIGQATGPVYLDHCNNHGAVSAPCYAGGLVGWINHGVTMTDCANFGQVSSTSLDVGGLVGKSLSAVMMERCYNYGTVSGTGSYTGGLVGQMNTDSTMHTLIACGNLGTVTSSGSYVGGLLGYLKASSAVGCLSHCFNLGVVRNTNTDTAHASGLVGYVNSSTVSIVRSYNKGIVEATEATSAYPSQLFFNNNASISSNILQNYCLNNGVPAYHYLVDSTETAVTSDRQNKTVAVSSVTNGTLLGNLNTKATVYTQTAVGPLTPGAIASTGVTVVDGLYYLFDANGVCQGRYNGTVEADGQTLYIRDGYAYVALVTFMAGGEVVDEIPYNPGDTVVAPQAPAIIGKTSYNYIEGAHIVLYEYVWPDFTLTGENMTVTAKYGLVQYDVFFYASQEDLDAGQVMAQRVYTIEDASYDIPAVPEKDGMNGTWKLAYVSGDERVIRVLAVYSESSFAEDHNSDNPDCDYKVVNGVYGCAGGTDGHNTLAQGWICITDGNGNDRFIYVENGIPTEPADTLNEADESLATSLSVSGMYLVNGSVLHVSVPSLKARVSA